MKIDNGMIVKVINLPTNKKHFGHLNDVGIVTDKRNNQFCIKFEDECCGFWSLDEIEIIDRNKQERINRRLKQIKSLKKSIMDIINEEEENLSESNNDYFSYNPFTEKYGWDC